MNEERRGHAAVSMGNKMFVIGGYRSSSSEIFDSLSRKFTLLKPFSKLCNIDASHSRVLCVGNRIIIFDNIYGHESKLYVYNVDKQIISNVDCAVSKNIYEFNCVKYFTQ